MLPMSTSCKTQSNLARSLNELYDNQLTEGEAQSASRYLVDFFKILDTVNDRKKRIQASNGCKTNEHLRSSN
jgi:hypothetical protein